MTDLQFWFDFSCPYAYVASTQVEALAGRTGATLDPRPMLLGGVFRARAVPQKLFATLGAAKARHNADDIRRTAARYEVPLEMPANHPLRTVDALRALLVVGPPFMPLAHAFYRAYWVDGVDIGTREGLARVLSEAGQDAEAVIERTMEPAIKEELRSRTDDAIELGVFGAPTFVLNGELYFGADRMDLVERALGGAPPTELPDPSSLAPIDFWFDYSSPFSYLASERVEAVLGPAATWRPMLLGGLFKMVEQVNVPYFAQSEAKQRHTQADLRRQAEILGVPFAWPSRFPMNTVLPLRVTMLAGATASAEGRRLVHRIFRAFWAEDRDISQPEVIEEICADLGLDGAGLIEGTQDPTVKAALKDATAEAAAAGVFGAPTFVVHPEGSEPRLYWGADRLEMAARAAAGDERLW